MDRGAFGVELEPLNKRIIIRLPIETTCIGLRGQGCQPLVATASSSNAPNLRLLLLLLLLPVFSYYFLQISLGYTWSNEVLPKKNIWGLLL